jgi:signal transduction histidine kinase
MERRAAGAAEPIAPESAHFVSAASLRVRSDWFNRMRWSAALGVAVVSLLAVEFGGVALPLLPILLTAAALAALNATYTLRNRRVPAVDIRSELLVVKLQMVLDLLLLTVLLSFSGGIENPFHFIYIIHVLLAGLLFKGSEIRRMALLAGLLFTAEVLGEALGVIPHHHLSSGPEMSHDWRFVSSGLAAFWLVLVGCAYLSASIMRHNRTIKDELVVRQRQLVEADKAKIDFFRYVSHEVKTPVVTAQSAVEAVLAVAGADMAEKPRDLLRRTVERLRQATEIVQGLSDLTRGPLHQGQDVRDVNLNRVIAALLDGQQSLIESRGLRVEARLPAEDVLLRASETMVEKVLANLISNAVRYNHDGGRLIVELRDLGDAVRVAVTDEGIGIRPEDLGRIFDEFYRTPEAKAASSLGTGLGLPIVKRFIEQMGGEIAVESEPGRGSTFTATLRRS